MRVRVLPREVASSIITGTVAMMGWGAGFLTIVLTVPLLIETMAQRGRATELPLPLAMLAVLLAGIAVVVRFPRPWVVAGYLLVGGAASVAYEVLLLHGDPSMLDDALFAVNRPTLALVAVGITATTALVGISWVVAGYVVANLVCAIAAVIAQVPFRPGLGPTMVLVVAVVGYLTLASIQLWQRRRLPNFDELEAETQRLAIGEDLARRTTAVVHDTVLNDLSIVMNAPDELDERTRRRLLEDLETLRGAEWLSATDALPSVDEEDPGRRNEIMLMVSEFQWRGLSVHVTGSGSGVYRLRPAVAEALIRSVRACFENALRHSGDSLAELELMYTDDAITVMVTDDGAGFDPADVAGDRLGLRVSVVDRMAAVGGSARIWSAPGAGTSVMIVAPAEVVEPNPESPHRSTA